MEPEGRPMQQQLLPVSDPAGTAIAQSESRRRKRRSLVYLLLVASAAIGYILSPGPFLLMTHHYSPPPAIEPVVRLYFAPIGWAMSRFPIVEDFYKRYFELIGVDL